MEASLINSPGIYQVISILYVLVLALKEILILALLVQGVRYLSYMLKYRKYIKDKLEKDNSSTEIFKEETIVFEEEEEDIE